MKKLMEKYAVFERAMNRDKVYLDLSFEEICSAIGADVETLDKLLLSEIGLGGQETVDFYRSKFC
ncbi:MAG: hypothetical protein IKW89_11300 [Bacteroidales bacterium]|nr:hypothetical protein [Bacteroidales bacterium]